MTAFEAPSPEAILDGLKGKTYLVDEGGVEKQIVLYPIAELAKALGRQVVTIRKWETLGRIPQAPFTKPGIDDKHGRRRLYSAAQVVGIVQIAAEEGILLDPYRPRRGQICRQVGDTKFSERVFALFQTLLEAA